MINNPVETITYGRGQNMMDGVGEKPITIVNPLEDNIYDTKSEQITRELRNSFKAVNERDPNKVRKKKALKLKRKKARKNRR